MQSSSSTQPSFFSKLFSTIKKFLGIEASGIIEAEAMNMVILNLEKDLEIMRKHNDAAFQEFAQQHENEHQMRMQRLLDELGQTKVPEHVLNKLSPPDYDASLNLPANLNSHIQRQGRFTETIVSERNEESKDGFSK